MKITFGNSNLKSKRERKMSIKKQDPVHAFSTGPNNYVNHNRFQRNQLEQNPDWGAF